LCLSGLGWDDPIPEDCVDVWNKWKRCVNNLEGIKIPRPVAKDVRDYENEYRLHVFSDASESGYGAVAYMPLSSCATLSVGRSKSAATSLSGSNQTYSADLFTGPPATVTQVDVSLELQSLCVIDTEEIRSKLKLPNLPISFNAHFRKKHAKMFPHLADLAFNKIPNKRIGLLICNGISEALLPEKEWRPFEHAGADHFGPCHVKRGRGPREYFRYLFIRREAWIYFRCKRYFLYFPTRRKRRKHKEIRTERICPVDKKIVRCSFE
jgi:hypothetical protein